MLTKYLSLQAVLIFQLFLPERTLFNQSEKNKNSVKSAWDELETQEMLCSQKQILISSIPRKYLLNFF